MQFTFSSTEHDEIKYVRSQLRQLPFFRRHNYRVIWPELLRADIANDRIDFTDDVLLNAIREHEFPAGPSLSDVEAGWSAILPKLNELLFDQIIQPIEPVWKVHVTKFGPGGSCQRHSPPYIVVQFPQVKGIHSNQTLLHEAIEILVRRRALQEEEMYGNNLGHARKEAVVDMFCSAQPLEEIVGTYKKQQLFAENLPPKWESWLPLKNGTDLFQNHPAYSHFRVEPI